MTRHWYDIALICLLAELAGGCTSPKARFYTMTSDAAPAKEAGAANGSAYSVAISPITVPDTVDRPQLVVRTGANQLLINEDNRWAEPLRGEIPRVIGQDLANLLGISQVSSYPQRAGDDADVRVTIDIQRFDATMGGSATVEALWGVSRKSSPPTPAVKGHTLATEKAGADGYDALVAAYRRALGVVSHDIAAAIRSSGPTTAIK